ncbi:MAG: beta-galactosidase [Phycisphaerales bacterium]|nr:MAG: beta-galactosidase [Phycisphaerales bacterium]
MEEFVRAKNVKKSILFIMLGLALVLISKSASGGSVSAAFDTLACDGRAGIGKCIFTKFPGNKKHVPEHAKGNPYVGGIEAKITWAELEPEKGKYAWEKIDDFLSECAKYDLQAAFKFWTVSGKVMSDGQLAKGKGRAGPDVVYRNTDTPPWLFQDPSVKKLGGFMTPKGRLPYYPVFRDKAYQKHLEEFIVAFARRYDGHPRIEYIRIGGWQILTNEPSFYGGASEFLVDQLLEQGMDVRGKEKDLKIMRNLPGDSPYSIAVLDMMDIWYRHFKKTRLGVTVHPSKEQGSFEDVQMKHAFEKKALIVNTGLNEADKSSMRQLYRQAYEKHGCKVGWGDLTHVGRHGKERELQKKGISLWREIARQAVGSDIDPQYTPASKISYVIFSSTALKDVEATKWLYEHLVR